MYEGSTGDRGNTKFLAFLSKQTFIFQYICRSFMFSHTYHMKIKRFVLQFLFIILSNIVEAI